MYNLAYVFIIGELFVMCYGIMFVKTLKMLFLYKIFQSIL